MSDKPHNLGLWAQVALKAFGPSCRSYAVCFSQFSHKQADEPPSWGHFVRLWQCFSCFFSHREMLRISSHSNGIVQIIVQSFFQIHIININLESKENWNMGELMLFCFSNIGKKRNYSRKWKKYELFQKSIIHCYQQYNNLNTTNYFFLVS